ncbi:MAG: hypothetical protein ACRCRV_00730 [Cetobacterium sp.]
MKYIWIFFIVMEIALGYTNIAPLYLDEKIDGEGAYREYIITNNTERTLKYRVYGEGKENTLDMTPWMEIYPRVITLKPGSREKIKVFIQGPKGIPQGEYISNLCVKEIEYPNRDSKKKLQIYTKLKIELAGFVGEEKGKIKIERKSSRKIALENIGYKREKLDIYFIGKNNKERKFLGSMRLFKGEKKILENEILEGNQGKIEVVDRNKNILLEKSLN